MAASRPGGRVIAPRGVLPFFLGLLPAAAAVVALLRGGVTEFGYGAGLTLLFFLAGWLLRRGLAAAGRSALPLRTLAALLLGAATFGLARLLALHDLLPSLLFGAGALAGSLLAYGSELWPSRAEQLNADQIDAARLVAEAREKLRRLSRARYRIQGAPELARRLDGVGGWVEKILTRIEEDPRDLRRARKFLVVYLDGAGEVTEKYVAYQAKGEAAAFTPRLHALLEEMERVAAEQHEKLLHNDTLDLDVQIAVLSERLKKEGVA
jgi:hypothetical protein